MRKFFGKNKIWLYGAGTSKKKYQNVIKPSLNELKKKV